MSDFRKNGNLYVANGGLVILLGASTVEQTGLTAGETYEFTATGGTALVRWGADDASIADAGFDFAVPASCVVRARVPTGDSAVNIIEAEAGSTGTAIVTMARLNAEE